MINDIFAYRYKDTSIWETFGEPERQLLVQAFQIVIELFPYWIGGAVYLPSKDTLTSIHDKLCRELGVTELSPKHMGYYATLFGETIPQVETYTMDMVCQNFVLAGYDGSIPADRFMKERISFIELAFREKEKELTEFNSKLPIRIHEARNMAKRRMQSPDILVNSVTLENQARIDTFKAIVGELNERFRRSGCRLHYHNRFIQQSSDELTKQQVEEPFWGVVSGQIWKNVDIDMKEAVDRRDNGDRDPAFYAARALESTIKIISHMKKWTIGNEGGAHAYIDNLCNKKRGGNLIEGWEKEALKHFFTKVRNPMVHGAGSAEMPQLNPSQTDWAIEFCMSWIKSLIRRA